MKQNMAGVEVEVEEAEAKHRLQIMVLILLYLSKDQKQTKRERGSRGRGGRGIGQHRATETLYVSDDDDMSILKDGPMPTQQKKGRAQVIEDSDDDDDGVIPQNECSHTAHTIRCGIARP